ncbi:hypothetical protein HYC85_011884 [Camellia sinensis]|uniref:RRM domain-containing protein n=1 Tax=Camellia sinensis TaxID=4442 RepID=A0A7J7HCB9_CAMSI|nr:hypothetical protein HYC85_011884 [Camellia sinensis]
MTSRGGRDRFRRDYLPRSEEKSHYGRNNVPPSRHLWVGNLSHHISENTLADQFLRFGDLERVAFQPGRSYAFVNFKNEEDACEAMRALQGYVVAGNPLRIEFTKADKSSTPSREDDYLKRRDERRDEQRSGGTRRSPFSQRDSRSYRPSPEPHYPDRPKTSDKNAEPPSEVLWIGFPALLKVDEFILRKAFSPFGEIEKITAFPGRSYAFVRFRNVMAACRAKETLQGKLFGNPRVHICFAKSESGSSNSGRNSMNSPPSPRFKSYGRAGSSENFRQDRKFGSLAGDPTMRSPRFISDLESGDPDVVNFGRKENMYERHSSPKRDRGAHFRDFSPQEFPRKGPIFDDSWDLPEDDLVFHRAKKVKTSNFPPENELPEYPFSGAEQAKHGFPRMFPDFPQPEALDKNFEPGSFGYKQIPDQAMNLTQHYGERSDHWNAQPYGSFQAGSGSMPPNAIEWKKSTPELHQPSLTKEWKWEGTIAKGGTPVCRARCFPVGTVMDMTLKSSDVFKRVHVFESLKVMLILDSTTEFMNYLGEKERAAVAKLDERTTLFVVPPSEFSEKVLKVPGKLSISGVVLRNNYMLHQRNHPAFAPNSSSHHMQNLNSSARNVASQSGPSVDPSVQGYNNTVMPRTAQETNSGSYSSGIAGIKLPPVSSSMPVAALQPEQLAQLASSLLGQQPRQSMGEDFRHSSTTVNHSENAYRTPQTYGLQNNPVHSDLSSSSQFGQMQQMQPPQQQHQGSNVHVGPRTEFQTGSGASGNQQQLQSGSTQEEDADPQKRLQATLQLAAALLQQIQQGKGN